MAKQGILTPLHDALYRKQHFPQHFIGGIVWWAILHLPPFWGLDWYWRLCWVGVIQGVWERYQKEYEPTYPYWSMAWDTALALVGASAAILMGWVLRLAVL